MHPAEASRCLYMSRLARVEVSLSPAVVTHILACRCYGPASYMACTWDMHRHDVVSLCR